MTKICIRLSACLLLIVPGLIFAQPVTDPGMITTVNGSEQGYVLFQERCMTCHGKTEMQNAPSPETLTNMSAQRIYEALTTGAMQVHARDLSQQHLVWVVEAVSGQRLGNQQAGDHNNMPNQCLHTPELANTPASWQGWDNGTFNQRRQKKSTINAGNVNELELLWAFGFSDGVSAFSQPAIVGNTLFVGSDTGYVYALDTRSGCVHWSFRADANVRSTPVVGTLDQNDSKTTMVFFGDMKAELYALDASTGALIWQTRGDEELSARVTASPVFHNGSLYVPMSSWEEAAARAQDYPCCTFRGSIAAYDAASGALKWKTYTIPQAQPLRVNSAGVQLYAPAGVSVWNVPVIDPAANALYFGTGDAFTYPAPNTSDAVIALDLDTGAILWQYQVYSDDAFLVGCRAAPSENCPEILGPDYDIPASLILVEQPGGTRALIVPTRPGEILSLDPDNKGALNWRVRASENGSGGGMLWAGAADKNSVYFGLVSGGMIATDFHTGDHRWFSPLAEPGQAQNSGASASLVEGVVFIGGIDGVVHALSTADGSELWSYATTREFDTVNAVPARGGSVTAAGPVVAGNSLFVSSGYQVIYGIPGNVLLAFALKQAQ